MHKTKTFILAICKKYFQVIRFSYFAYFISQGESAFKQFIEAGSVTMVTRDSNMQLLVMFSSHLLKHGINSMKNLYLKKKFF